MCGHGTVRPRRTVHCGRCTVGGRSTADTAASWQRSCEAQQGEQQQAQQRSTASTAATMTETASVWCGVSGATRQATTTASTADRQRARQAGTAAAARAAAWRPNRQRHTGTLSALRPRHGGVGITWPCPPAGHSGAHNGRSGHGLPGQGCDTATGAGHGRARARAHGANQTPAARSPRPDKGPGAVDVPPTCCWHPWVFVPPSYVGTHPAWTWPPFPRPG